MFPYWSISPHLETAHLIICLNEAPLYMHIDFILIRSTLSYRSSQRLDLDSAWLRRMNHDDSKQVRAKWLTAAWTHSSWCDTANHVWSLLLPPYWIPYVKWVCMGNDWRRERQGENSVQKIGYPKGLCLLPQERPVSNKSFNFHALSSFNPVWERVERDREVSCLPSSSACVSL